MRLVKLSDRQIKEQAIRELANRWIGDDDEGRLVEADLADDALLDAWGWIDLAAPVLHPWLLEPAAAALAITPHQLRAVLHQDGPGWDEEGGFVDHHAVDDGPYIIEERLGAEVAPTLMMRHLPVLSKRSRDAHPGMDRLYRFVLRAAATMASYVEADAPLSLLSWRAVELQASVESLFDNASRELVHANLDGSPLPSLAEVVDAASDSTALELALRGAGLALC